MTISATRKALLAVTGLVAMGFAQSSFAVPIPNVEYGAGTTFAGSYDPLLTNNNTISHSICGIGNDCDAADAGMNMDTWQLSFVNNGVLTLSAVPLTLPLIEQFDTFTLVVKNAAGTTVATFPPLSPNPIAVFTTAAGQFYTIELSWSITDALAATADASARYSLNVTTAPAPRVPEPGSLALLGLGLLGLGAARRRKA